MGKVRRFRKKYHLSKLESAKSAEKKVEEPGTVFEPMDQSLGNVLGSTENIFAGLDISIDQLTKTLPQDLDAKSVASTKSRRELKLEEQHLKKKEKLRLKRERFLKKLEVTKQAIKDAKKKKKRGRKPETDNLNCTTNTDDVNYKLNDGLPGLKSLPAKKNKRRGKVMKAKPIGMLKSFKRIKQQTKDARLMAKILSSNELISNPQKITEYLKQKVASER